MIVDDICIIHRFLYMPVCSRILVRTRDVHECAIIDASFPLRAEIASIVAYPWLSLVRTESNEKKRMIIGSDSVSRGSSESSRWALLFLITVFDFISFLLTFYRTIFRLIILIFEDFPYKYSLQLIFK
jgi:hypothetical protein